MEAGLVKGVCGLVWCMARSALLMNWWFRAGQSTEEVIEARYGLPDMR